MRLFLIGIGVLAGLNLAAAGAEPLLKICNAPRGRDAMVALTYDDGSIDGLTHAAPMMEKRGFRGTFYPIAAQIGVRKKYLNWAQLKELGTRGHEIGNHSMNHHHMTKILAAKEYERFAMESLEARRMIAEKTGFSPRTFCYPGNGRNAATDAEILKSHDLTMPSRVGYGSWTTPEKHEAEFPKMLQPGRLTVIMLHGIVADGGGWAPFKKLEYFEKLLDDLHANRDKIYVGTFWETGSYDARRRAATLKELERAATHALYEVVLPAAADRFRGELWLSADPTAAIAVNTRPVEGELTGGRRVFPVGPGDVVRVTPGKNVKKIQK